MAKQDQNGTEEMRLSPREQKTIADALINPPAPGDALRRAVARYRLALGKVP